jgi:hypothetical protein
VAGANGTGSLVDLTFDALSAGATSIELHNIVLLDSSLEDIAFEFRNGAIVVGSTGVPEPPTSALILLAAMLAGLARRRCPAAPRRR